MKILTILLLSMSMTAAAMQTIDAAKAGPYQVTLAAHEPNHIWIEGERILRIIGRHHAFETMIEKDHGDVYIKPMMEAGSFDIFVISDDGSNYKIHATIADKGASEIHICPRHKNDIRMASRHVTKVRKLILRLYAEAMAAPHLTGVNINYSHHLQLMRLKTIEENGIYGEVFKVTNATGNIQNISERQFLLMEDNIIAISILSRQLKPGAETIMFVVHGVMT